MSGISNDNSPRQVHGFAEQGLDDEVHLKAESNKGSLGQKVATFFSDSGEALGLIGDGDRRQRQKDSLDGFRQSLTDI